MRWRQAGSRCDRASHHLKCLGTLGLTVGLAACASYEALPLPEHARLAPELSKLDLSLPPQDPGQPAATINPSQSLTPNQVALLAMVNNPDLAVLRSNIAVADADLFAARLLPNPSVGLGYASLVSGPGTADAMTASISQDIQSIITYRPRVDAARERKCAKSVPVRCGRSGRWRRRRGSWRSGLIQRIGRSSCAGANTSCFEGTQGGRAGDTGR